MLLFRQPAYYTLFSPPPNRYIILTAGGSTSSATPTTSTLFVGRASAHRLRCLHRNLSTKNTSWIAIGIRLFSLCSIVISIICCWFNNALWDSPLLVRLYYWLNLPKIQQVPQFASRKKFVKPC